MTEHDSDRATARKNVAPKSAKARKPKSYVPRLSSFAWWAAVAFATAGVLVSVCYLACFGASFIETKLEGRQTTPPEPPPVIAAGNMCAGANQCDPAAYFQGVISIKSVAQLQAFLVGRPNLRWVCFESGGGDSSAGLDMANWIHQRGLNTCVVPRSTSGSKAADTICASACSNIWLAGASRRLSPAGGSVGVHGRYVGTNSCCAPANAIANTMARIDSWLNGRSYGDDEARRILNEKARNCRPAQVYHLRTQEAIALRLIPRTSAGLQWAWTPDNSEVKFGEPVKAYDCSKQQAVHP